MSTPYQLDATSDGTGKLQVTVTKDGEVIAEFEANDAKDADKKGKAYAAQHKANNLPAPIRQLSYTHDFHL